MPEVLGNPPSPRAVLFWNGTAWQWALVGPGGRLQVRGEDQLHSFQTSLADKAAGVISGADGYLDSNSPPDGTVWVVTSIAAWDKDNPTTKSDWYLRKDAVLAIFYDHIAAIAAGIIQYWHGWKWLEHDEVFRIYFAGALAADRIEIDLTGYAMTKET